MGILQNTDNYLAIDTELWYNTSMKTIQDFIRIKGLEPESIHIIDDESFIVENTFGDRAVLTELSVSLFKNTKFETLIQNKFEPGRKITSPIEVIFSGSKYIIIDGANRTTQAIANGDKTIPAIVSNN